MSQHLKLLFSLNLIITFFELISYYLTPETLTLIVDVLRNISRDIVSGTITYHCRVRSAFEIGDRMSSDQERKRDRVWTIVRAESCDRELLLIAHC